jgi:hypothetical protein
MPRTALLLVNSASQCSLTQGCTSSSGQRDETDRRAAATACACSSSGGCGTACACSSSSGCGTACACSSSSGCGTACACSSSGGRGCAVAQRQQGCTSVSGQPDRRTDRPSDSTQEWHPCWGYRGGSSGVSPGANRQQQWQTGVLPAGAKAAAALVIVAAAAAVTPAPAAAAAGAAAGAILCSYSDVANWGAPHL